jgi:hypothetical protein
MWLFIFCANSSLFCHSLYLTKSDFVHLLLCSLSYGSRWLFSPPTLRTPTQVYVYIYIYICMYIYVYIYIYAHTYTQVYRGESQEVVDTRKACNNLFFLTCFFPKWLSFFFSHSAFFLQIHTHTYIHIYTHIYLYIYIQISLSVSLSLSLYIYMYIYLYIYR